MIRKLKISPYLPLLNFAGFPDMSAKQGMTGNYQLFLLAYFPTLS